MKATEIKEDIVKMLEDIISRTDYINYHHPDKDLSLDIDLMKDDLRMLYRYMDLLKSLKTHPVQSSALDAKADEQIIEKSEKQFNEQVDEKTDEQVQEQVQVVEKSAEQVVEQVYEKTDENLDEQDDKKEDDNISESQAATEHIEAESTTDEIAQDAMHAEEVQTEEVSSQEEQPKEANEETGEEIPAIKPTDLLPGLENIEAEEEKPENDAGKSPKESIAGNSKKSIIDLLGAYSQKTIGDHYAEADNSLNKRISDDQQDNSIGTRMQLNPISNIKEVIGLNEKFLFINELFSGNIQEYHSAIARLNDMENMQAAFDHLNELSVRYAWDAERSTETIRKLATYVQRRYLKSSGQ